MSLFGLSSDNVIALLGIVITVLGGYNTLIFSGVMRRIEKIEAEMGVQQGQHTTIMVKVAEINGKIETINQVMQARREFIRYTDGKRETGE